MTTTYENTAWYDDAACQGFGELFFTDEWGARPARIICEGCTVRETCLEYALDHHIDDGVWGGLTAIQRKRERAKRRRARGVA